MSDSVIRIGDRAEVLDHGFLDERKRELVGKVYRVIDVWGDLVKLDVGQKDFYPNFVTDDLKKVVARR